MKNILTSILAVLISVSALATTTEKSAMELYIEKYAPLAVAEMYRSGVPASITLAQGLLESASGQSELAQKANNHFGIKCHAGWEGGKYMYNDEVGRECYRKYSHVSESYSDHSDFIRYRDRYKFLFDYKVTDYKAWAYGLKKAGYATDPAYPTKLINLIETYNLYEYDRKPASYGKKSDDKKSSKKGKTVIEFVGESLPEELVTEQLPLSPTVIEQVKELGQKQREEFHFSLDRKMYSQNAVPFVYAVAGDTYASIAASYNLFTREILKFNDLEADAELLPGTVVYLKPKKKSAAKGVEKYVVEEGESLRDIAQRYGVRLASMLRLNGFEKGYVPREGDVVLLRK